MAFQAFEPRHVRFRLQGARRAALIILAALVPVAALTAETLRVATAAAWGASQKIRWIRRSLQIDPGNSHLYHQLGMRSYVAVVSLDSAQRISPVEAIDLLKKASQLNPREVSYWSDLAAVCDALRQDCTRPALERALSLAPMRPRLHWLAGNYYLREGETEPALAEFHQLLALDPSYAPDTFRICLRVLGDSASLLDGALLEQADTEVKLAYIDTLMEQDQAGAAYEAWTRMVKTSSRFSMKRVQPLLEKLIALKRIDEAESVWLDLERMGVVAAAGSGNERERIFNGDFERVPLNAGFDWRYVDTPYVSMDFADGSPYHGARCLRVEFTVSRNEEYEPVYELAPVLPNQTYTLSAYVRSEGITSDSGPRLRVSDPGCQSCLDAAEGGTVRTTPWHPVRLSFSTGPSTRLVKVSVWRPRGRTYPMTISGTFWLDAVSLEPSAAETASRN